jgi:hypothetical protein
MEVEIKRTSWGEAELFVDGKKIYVSPAYVALSKADICRLKEVAHAKKIRLPRKLKKRFKKTI